MYLHFVFKEKSVDITPEELERWMSVPLGRKKIDLMDREQAEAAHDLVCSKEDFLTEKEINLLCQVAPKQFAELFTLEEDTEPYES